MAEKLGLGAKYVAGLGENQQFRDRIPDAWENNGLSNWDHLYSPDWTYVLYKPKGGTVSKLKLELKSLSTLMLINNKGNIKLKQPVSPLQKVK